VFIIFIFCNLLYLHHLHEAMHMQSSLSLLIFWRYTFLLYSTGLYCCWQHTQIFLIEGCYVYWLIKQVFSRILLCLIFLRGEVWFYQICARKLHEFIQKLLITLLMNDLAFHIFVCMKCFVGTLDMDMQLGLTFLVFLVANVWERGGPLT